MTEHFYVQIKLPSKERRLKPEFRDANNALKRLLSYSYDNYCVEFRNSRRNIPESKWQPVMYFPNFNVPLGDLYELYRQKFIKECNPDRGYEYSDDVKCLVNISTVLITSRNADDCLKQLLEKFPDSWVWNDILEEASEWTEKLRVIDYEKIDFQMYSGDYVYYLTFIRDGKLVTEEFDEEKHKLSYEADDNI